MPNLRPIVMKFGGTSVEDAAAFERAAEIVSRERDRQAVVVVSAMSRFTDALLRSTREAVADELEKANDTVATQLARHFEIAELFEGDERDSLISNIQLARKEVARLLTAIAA